MKMTSRIPASVGFRHFLVGEQNSSCQGPRLSLPDLKGRNRLVISHHDHTARIASLNTFRPLDVNRGGRYISIAIRSRF